MSCDLSPAFQQLCSLSLKFGKTCGDRLLPILETAYFVAGVIYGCILAVLAILKQILDHHCPHGIKATVSRFSRGNILVVTHGDGVAAAVRLAQPDATVYEVQHTGWAHLHLEQLIPAREAEVGGGAGELAPLSPAIASHPASGSPSDSELHAVRPEVPDGVDGGGAGVHGGGEDAEVLPVLDELHTVRQEIPNGVDGGGEDIEVLPVLDELHAIRQDVPDGVDVGGAGVHGGGVDTELVGGAGGQADVVCASGQSFGGSNPPVAELPCCVGPPGDDLPIGELPMQDLPVGDLPKAELPVKDLPVGEQPCKVEHPNGDLVTAFHGDALGHEEGAEQVCQGVAPGHVEGGEQLCGGHALGHVDSVEQGGHGVTLGHEGGGHVVQGVATWQTDGAKGGPGLRLSCTVVDTDECSTGDGAKPSQATVWELATSSGENGVLWLDWLG